MRHRRSLLMVLSCLLSLTLIGCSNFHEVHRGNLYRSGQLSAGTLRRVIQEHGIKIPYPHRRVILDKPDDVVEPA